MTPFDLPVPTTVLRSEASIRPQKRQRVEAAVDGSSSAAGGGRKSTTTSPQSTSAMTTAAGVAGGGSTTTPVRKRAPTACDSCRSRKTKCDNVKPACGSCVRTGIECYYSGLEEKELSLYESTSLRILEGIERLEKLMKNPPAHQPPHPPAPRSIVPSPLLSTATAHSTPAHVVDREDQVIIDEFTSSTTPTVAGSGLLPATELRVPSRLDSVLAWSVFPRDHPQLTIPASTHTAIPPPTASPAPPQTTQRLHDIYVMRVRPSHPISDLAVLERAMLSVAKSGFLWDLDSCLIALTCALGAISENYADYVLFDPPRNSSGETELARHYWSMAQQRLGLAMSEDSELAVQCLCLSGFWYLYNLEPISAYKAFHTACVTWQTLHNVTTGSGPSNSCDATGMTYEQYLKQRLYWTCLKAECELRAALSLPVPTGSQMEYPLHFPAPPTSFEPQHYTDVENQSWYYYTAEIFLRRLHNRIVHEVSSFECDLDNPATVSKALNQQRLASLVTITREFEAYVSRWQSSLPPSVHFPNPFPPVDITPLEDEFQQHLRKRFIECHELLYRPYINLALNHLPWLDSLSDSHLQWEVSHFSSLALSYAVYNLSTDRGAMWYRNPGVWFDCRARLCDTLILRAAAGNGFQMQMGWEEVVEKAERALEFWAGVAGKSGLGSAWEVCRWSRGIWAIGS
ncbi:uncharacterized protein H6S33_011780 [Morchella sextelata]|uniref:uncharacterized protein n=1 Tax=Morchella sextelata TaxID=1174677 RepID=UPI001D04A36D|nr:uncharacterized protein H6S33_011780 [Morchella sextelata]KAH0610253.1 hypothetical protein H6S33_011780 [Morchella sextelata]